MNTPKYPKFRTDIEVFDYEEADGAKSKILKEPMSERFFRLSEDEYRLLRGLDGRASPEEVLAGLQREGVLFTQDEARTIILRAGQYGLALGTAAGTSAYIKSTQDRLAKEKRSRFLASYYFASIPLINPDRFLDKTLWLFKLICNRWTGTALAAAVPLAGYLLFMGWPRIHTEYLFFFNWTGALYLWAVIVLTKLIHEFSHAYAAKSFGLRVPQMGVALLLFLPCLFCNTTEAWQLADRRQRMVISAAGILAEAALAVISLFVWYFTKPGMLNSLAFYLMTLSLVSTAIFNGNPLIKLDGYFVLMDWLRVPNLAGKASEHVKSLFMNRILGMSAVESPAENRRDNLIFTTYGLCAFVYRLFLYFGIVSGIYYRFDKFLGIALAVPAFVVFVIRPIVKGVSILYQRRAELAPRPKAASAFALAVACLLATLFMPLPCDTSFPCYIVAERSRKITAPLFTAVKEVYVREGQSARAGETLFSLDTSRLETAISKKLVEREILNKEIELLLLSEEKRSAADAKGIRLLRVDDEIARLRRQQDLAKDGIRAPFDCVVTFLDPRMQPGFRPGEGAVVGEMEDLRGRKAIAFTPEEDLSKIAPGLAVKVALPLGAGRVIHGRVESVRPYSEKNIENSPFSSRLGGAVATEASADHITDAPLGALYSFSVPLGNAEEIPLGMTGKAKAPSPPRSFASRFVDGLLMTFNRESLL
jgi:putative peptide zinc metalloprotease protein